MNLPFQLHIPKMTNRNRAKLAIRVSKPCPGAPCRFIFLGVDIGMLCAWRKLLAALGLAACMSVQAAHAQEGPLRVVATFLILADMAREIGGDAVAVTSLMPMPMSSNRRRQMYGASRRPIW